VREPRGHHDDGVSVQCAFIAGVHARGTHAVRGYGADRGVGPHVDAGADHSLADACHLECVGGPLRNVGGRGDQRDVEALFGEQLGDDTAHVIVVVVEHDDALPARPGTRHDVVGAQDLCAFGDLHWFGVPAADTVVAPGGAGGHDDVIEVVVDDVVGGHLALHENVDVALLANLLFRVIDDPDPGRQARQFRFPCDAAAKSAGGFGQAYGVAAVTQSAGGFQTGRSGTDHQHCRVTGLAADFLGMPTAAEFLA